MKLNTKEKFLAWNKKRQQAAAVKVAQAKNKALRMQALEADRKRLYAEIDARRGDGLLLQDLDVAESDVPLSEVVVSEPNGLALMDTDVSGAMIERPAII